MANRITYANVYSESRNNIKDLISANVTDPIISSAEYRKWIYSREPDVKSSDFAGYPFIIIYGSNVDPVLDKSSCDGKSKFVDFTIEIEIVTSDRGYEDGKGLTHMDSISNGIFEVLLNHTNRRTLRQNGLSFADPSASSVVQEPIQNELTYRRSFILSLRTRMTVSA